jgi:23S rRNA (cytosine1962-C5)-methyltransferase
MPESIIVVQKGREKPIIQQHPWIFSGAIAEVKGSPLGGDVVTVVTSEGKFLARGYWNYKSQIQVRILTWQDEAVDVAWWRSKLERAIHARSAMKEISNAMRLVNAENDYLPGLIVDQYGDWLVIQSLTLGIETRKMMIVELLAELLQPKGIYERSDVDVRNKEGLPQAEGLLWGEEPPKFIPIDEYGIRILVDVRKGHKTGYYLDQRASRARLRDLLGNYTLSQPNDFRLINLFSYTGSFGLHALAMGVGQVLNVDSYREALEHAEDMVADNDASWAERMECLMGDCFEVLRDFAQANEKYDVVILDPPKFAHNAGQVEKAARGYKDLNLHAFKIIKEGGYLMTFSCSGAITADLFQKIVFGALADSGRQGQIIAHLEPAADHPIALTFPEGAYLKGLLVRVW